MNKTLFRFECADCDRKEVVDLDGLFSPDQVLKTLRWSRVGDEVRCPIHSAQPSEAKDANP